MSIATTLHRPHHRPAPVEEPQHRSRRGRARFGSRKAREATSAWVLLIPLIVVYTLFLVVPLVITIVQSFEQVKVSGLGLSSGQLTWAGLSNYAQVLSDPAVWKGFARVLLIGIIQVPLMLCLSVLMALLFDSTVVRLRRFFQMSAFLPYAVPGIVGAVLWSFMYQPAISPILQGLSAIGININPLSQGAVLFSIMNMTTWQWTGYNMIIVFASLQAIPPEILESAELDGASGIKSALRIKLPMVRPAVIVTAVFCIIGALQQFADPTVLQSISTAIDSNFTPNMAVYNYAMGQNKPYLAAALAVVLALVAFVCSFGFLKFTSRKED